MKILMVCLGNICRSPVAEGVLRHLASQKNIKIEVESTEELREIVGETFINELTKYINKITIGDNNLDLLTLDFKSRIKVVEKLPSNTINKVLKFIENYRQKTKELTSISINGLQKDLPVDASLFNI